MATWALLSWFGIGNRDDALCIHDDGSLQVSDKERFQTMLPGCRIISRQEADAKALEVLYKFPSLQTFRQENNLALKAFDFFWYARSEKIILLDSDVLTFDRITCLDECLAWSWNLFLKDYQYAFNINKAGFRMFSAAASYKPINTGFGVVSQETLNLDVANTFIETMDRNFCPFWAEQTLYAIMSAPFGVELLDDSFVVAKEPGLTGITMKHYVWKNRDLARLEGVPIIAMRLRDPLNHTQSIVANDAGKVGLQRLQ